MVDTKHPGGRPRKAVAKSAKTATEWKACADRAEVNARAAVAARNNFLARLEAAEPAIVDEFWRFWDAVWKPWAKMNDEIGVETRKLGAELGTLRSEHECLKSEVGDGT